MAGLAAGFRDLAAAIRGKQSTNPLAPPDTYEEYLTLQGSGLPQSAAAGGSVRPQGMGGFVAVERIRGARRARPEFEIMQGYTQIASDLDTGEGEQLQSLNPNARPSEGSGACEHIREHH